MNIKRRPGSSMTNTVSTTSKPFEKKEDYIEAIFDMSMVLSDLGMCEKAISRAIMSLDITRGDFLDLEITELDYERIKKLTMF